MAAELQSAETEPVRLGVLLSVVQACIYFGFILVAALSPQILQIRVYGSITLSFLLGLGVIVSGVMLTLIYVTYANSGSPRESEGARQ